MKKIFYVMALMLTAVGFTACSSSDDDTPSVTINFEQAQYTLDGAVGDKVVITAKTSAAVSQATRVAIGFSAVNTVATSTTSSAVTPYKLSSDAFEFAAGSNTASITITRQAVCTGSMTITLTPAAGVNIGNLSSTVIVFAGPNIYTFETETDVLTDTREYKVLLETEAGKPFSYAADTDIPLVINGRSTAVEGTNYEFPNGKVAKFKAGKSEGTVTVKFLKYEEGKDKLLIQLDKSNLKAGNYGMLTVYVTGTPSFAGEWQYEGIWKSNAQWWNDSWMVDAAALALIVDGTSADSFKFEIADGGYQFTPNFSGKLKNYFTKACKAAYIGARDERMQELGMMNPPVWQLYRFKFDEVNKNMSATDNKKENGRVGFFFTTDEATNKELLIMTIYDYEPTDKTTFGYYTWASLYEMMAYSAAVETTMETAPIRVAFTKK